MFGKILLLSSLSVGLFGMSGLKMVKRISARNKSGSFMASEFSYKVFRCKDI